MDCNDFLDNKLRITVLKKMILLYLEQYMVCHLDQEINSTITYNKLMEDNQLKFFFRLLSRGLLLNLEQFIKSRKWMNDGNSDSIKNITITSINIIPEEDLEKLQSIGPIQLEKELKQVSSYDNISRSDTVVVPTETTKLFKSEEKKSIHQPSENAELLGLSKNYVTLDSLADFILAKLNFISLSLGSINKILEKSNSHSLFG